MKLIEDNFMLDYDCGHAQAVSVLAHNQVQPLEKCDEGQIGFIKMLNGKIGSVGINDCDNTTVMNEFATHLGLGKGVLGYDLIIPVLIELHYAHNFNILNGVYTLIFSYYFVPSN